MFTDIRLLRLQYLEQREQREILRQRRANMLSANNTTTTHHPQHDISPPSTNQDPFERTSSNSSSSSSSYNSANSTITPLPPTHYTRHHSPAPSYQSTASSLPAYHQIGVPPPSYPFALYHPSPPFITVTDDLPNDQDQDHDASSSISEHGQEIDPTSSLPTTTPTHPCEPPSAISSTSSLTLATPSTTTTSTPNLPQPPTPAALIHRDSLTGLYEQTDVQRPFRPRLPNFIVHTDPGARTRTRTRTPVGVDFENGTGAVAIAVAGASVPVYALDIEDPNEQQGQREERKTRGTRMGTRRRKVRDSVVCLAVCFVGLAVMIGLTFVVARARTRRTV